MKTWQKPTLIILTRNKAESVLSFCKSGAIEELGVAAPNGSPAYTYGSCYLWVSAPGGACGVCQQTDAS